MPPGREGGGEDCVGAPVSKKNGQGLGKKDEGRGMSHASYMTPRKSGFGLDRVSVGKTFMYKGSIKTLFVRSVISFLLSTSRSTSAFPLLP